MKFITRYIRRISLLDDKHTTAKMIIETADHSSIQLLLSLNVFLDLIYVL